MRKKMKKYIGPLLISLAIIASILLDGCYTQTVEDFSYYNFQFPLLFRSVHFNKAAPDTSWDFINLHNYSEYEDNKDRIYASEILSFNYWIDSLVFLMKDTVQQKFDTLIFDRNQHRDLVEFPFIIFKLVYAKLKPGYVDPNDKDSSHWDKDFSSPIYVLGSYYNVKVEEYYRYSHHIVPISDSLAKEISNMVKNRPQFWICTEYSPVKDQDTKIEPKRYFPFIAARYDMIIRFKIKL